MSTYGLNGSLHILQTIVCAQRCPLLEMSTFQNYARLFVAVRALSAETFFNNQKTALGLSETNLLGALYKFHPEVLN